MRETQRQPPKSPKSISLVRVSAFQAHGATEVVGDRGPILQTVQAEKKLRRIVAASFGDSQHNCSVNQGSAVHPASIISESLAYDSELIAAITLAGASASITAC